ncbi:MAG: elongation factor P--(R)-beta-lysine ligase, partial [Spirochaetaceae bacterium]|nr:elongation factor P--(R)-beta-lysine ligase [Spirochaetaceae bacterium]
TGYSYKDNIRDTEELFKYLITEKTPDFLTPPFNRISMEEAFIKYAGFSLESNYDEVTLRKELEKLSIHTEENDNWEVLFNRVFLQMVEPALPQNKPLVLYNYPSRIKTMAKDLPGTVWSERWELYAGGMEIANCFSEEKDPEKIREYYIEEDDLTHPVNQKYYEIFGNKFPDCSGVAMGMDRLIMLLTGEMSIEGVILFPLSDIISFRK